MKKLVLLLLVLFLLSGCSDDSVVYQAPMFNLGNCEDTDGGINIEEYGELTYTDDDVTISKEDFCVDDVFLVERKCQRNKIKTFKVDCSLFETTCVDGACAGIDLDEDVVEEILEEEIVEVNEEEVAEIIEEIVEEGLCTETDDGQDYYNYGANEGYMAGTWSTLYGDMCRGSPNYDLVEYYCDGDDIIAVTVDVPEGYLCDGGAFVLEGEYEYTCTETDGGQDYYTSGANEGYIGGVWSTNYHDICRGGPYNDLVEYYCDEDEDEIKGVAVGIPEGYVCEDGAFVLA